MEKREKTSKFGKIALCLANRLAEPPVEPCEAPRCGNDVLGALAIETISISVFQVERPIVEMMHEAR
jgi:hypothetical protein